MGIGMVLLSTMTLVTIQSSSAAEDVYVTKNGKKYHKEDCRLIKNKGAEKISKKDAVGKGLVPCLKCFKEESSQLQDKKKQDQHSLLAPAAPRELLMEHSAAS